MEQSSVHSNSFPFENLTKEDREAFIRSCIEQVQIYISIRDSRKRYDTRKSSSSSYLKSSSSSYLIPQDETSAEEKDSGPIGYRPSSFFLAGGNVRAPMQVRRSQS